MNLKIAESANRQIWIQKNQLLEACESAYTHLAIAWHFHDEMQTEADARMLLQLEQAIRAAGGKVIGVDGKEVK